MSYLNTLTRFQHALDIEMLVTGHGPMMRTDVIGFYLRYLSDLVEQSRKAARAGSSVEQLWAALPLAEEYLPPPSSPLRTLAPMLEGFHRWNIQHALDDATAGR